MALGFCAGCEKDRLGTSTFDVRVSPTVASVPQGGARSFSVTLHGSRETISTDGLASWSVSPSSLGTVSPSEGSQVTFTPAAVPGQSGTVQASLKGVTGSAQVFVQGSTTPGSSTSYSVFRESPSSPGIKFDVPNPPDADGTALCTFGSVTVAEGTAAGQFTEGTKSLKATFTAANSGYSIQWGSDGNAGCGSGDTATGRDFSSFAGGSLKFDARASQETQVSMRSTGGTPKSFNLNADRGLTLDDAFHSVSIPLSSFTGVTLSSVDAVSFFSGGSTSSGVFTVDNLRLEK